MGDRGRGVSPSQRSLADWARPIPAGRPVESPYALPTSIFVRTSMRTVGSTLRNVFGSSAGPEKRRQGLPSGSCALCQAETQLAHRPSIGFGKPARGDAASRLGGSTTARPERRSRVVGRLAPLRRSFQTRQCWRDRRRCWRDRRRCWRDRRRCWRDRRRCWRDRTLSVAGDLRGKGRRRDASGRSLIRDARRSHPHLDGPETHARLPRR